MSKKNSQELIQMFLANQEWQTFECKRAAIQPAKLLETVVAFANTDGGLIIIGLEDPLKGTPHERLIGISENSENVSEFLKLINKDIEPQLKLYTTSEISVINSKGKKDKLLIINVLKTDDIHSLKKGETFARKGKQNVKLTASEIIRLKYEKGAIKFEDEASEIKTLEDLDIELLSIYKADTNSRNEKDWQFLKDNGLAIKKNVYQLTKGGILLFAKNPSVRLGSKCGIKISHYYGTKINFSAEPNFVRRPFTIEGPLIYQIKKAVDYFKEVTRSSRPKLIGSTFAPSWLIPEWVFQESVTNAVIHRNYSIQDDIQIRFFDDRLEVESPGSYPGHITIINIRSERFSRNPLILRTLNRFQSAPNLDIGEGVDRMFKVMRDNNLYEPLYLPPTIRPNSVMVILFNLQRIEYWDTVSSYVDRKYRITNAQARKVTGIRDTLEMSRLLKSWVDKGILEKIESGFKGNVYYKKPGVDIPPSIFNDS